MTHRVIVNTTDGQTVEVFQGDESACSDVIKQLPGKPLLDVDGKEVGKIDKAWVEQN